MIHSKNSQIKLKTINIDYNYCITYIFTKEHGLSRGYSQAEQGTSDTDLSNDHIWLSLYFIFIADVLGE